MYVYTYILVSRSLATPSLREREGVATRDYNIVSITPALRGAYELLG